MNELLYRDRDWLYDKYINEQLSALQIAKMMNVSQSTILKWLRRFNIETRPIINKNPKVNEYFYEVMGGLMIGDGNLNIPNNYKNASFQIAQIEKQSDFIYWIANFLDEYNIEYKIYKRDKHKNGYIKKDGKVGIRNPQLRIETKRYELFNDIYYKHYGENGRLIPKDIKLTPLQLAIWYMSDGSLEYNKCAGSYQIRLSTYRYHINDLGWLVENIYDLYDIRFNMNRDGRVKNKNCGYRLTIGKKHQVYKFCKLIEPHICNCFKYKVECLKDEQWLSKII
jgi:transcriptional regulator with XRE-family HTH domain